MKRARGALTVFGALSIMLVAQFIFVLLEGARYCETKKMASIQNNEAVESVMAQYCVPLWEEYRLLAYDTGDYSGEMNLTQIDQEIINQQSKGIRKNLLDSQLQGDVIESYTLLSDHFGKVYIATVASYMKENILYEEAKAIYNDCRSAENVEKESGYKDSYITDAIDTLEDSSTNISKSNKADKAGSTGSTDSTDSDKKYLDENQLRKAMSDSNTKNGKEILKDVETVKAKGLMELLLPEGKELSARKMYEKPLSNRVINTGVNSTSYDNGWLEDILMCKYLTTYMSCYTDIKANHYMQYEMEYIIGGKDNDKENLELVIRRLLLIREAFNMLSITADVEKQSTLTKIATELVGQKNVVAIEVIKLGLAAAWAFCESILDIRALLQGDKVPLFKNQKTWTSGINGLDVLLSGNAKAKSSADGIDYKDYATILMVLNKPELMARAAMDLQEATLRNIKGYENVRIDNFLSDVTVETSYKFQPIFGKFVSLIKEPRKKFSQTVVTYYSYAKEKKKQIE